MLRISRLADYASRVMRHLAKTPDAALSAVQVSDQTGVALPTIRKILKQLQQADLLVSSRGKIGGYQLARAPESINLAQVVEALDGPIALTNCSLKTVNCDHLSQCGMQEDWQLINTTVRDALAKLSLADLQK